MLRVLATMQHSQYAGKMKSEMKDLADWVQDIHNGMYATLVRSPSFRRNSPSLIHPISSRARSRSPAPLRYGAQNQSSYLFTNYADDARTFADASSTALLASTVYRLALAAGVHTHLPLAERCREALSGQGNVAVWGTGDGAGAALTSTAPSSAPSQPAKFSSSVASTPSSTTTAPSSTSPAPSATAPAPGAGLAHFDAEMWLAPVVDPDNWARQGAASPEGQAFVVEMYAAWQEWVDAGAPGANAACGLRLGGGSAVWAAAMVGVVLAGGVL